MPQSRIVIRPNPRVALESASRRLNRTPEQTTHTCRMGRPTGSDVVPAITQNSKKAHNPNIHNPATAQNAALSSIPNRPQVKNDKTNERAARTKKRGQNSFSFRRSCVACSGVLKFCVLKRMAASCLSFRRSCAACSGVLSVFWDWIGSPAFFKSSIQIPPSN